MYHQTVRLVSIFGSGSCISSFGSSPKVERNCGCFQFWAYPKVETTDAFPVLGRFHFGACTTSDVHKSKVGHNHGQILDCSELALRVRILFISSYWQFDYDAPGQAGFFLQTHFEYFCLTSFLHSRSHSASNVESSV